MVAGRRTKNAGKGAKRATGREPGGTRGHSYDKFMVRHRQNPAFTRRIRCGALTAGAQAPRYPSIVNQPAPLFSLSMRAFVATALVAGSALALWFWLGLGQTDTIEIAAPLRESSTVAIAVLGDSDSHSFQDRHSFPPGSEDRGGRYRATSLQWTEVLGRLRGREVDLGEWGVYGYRGVAARLGRLVGKPLRSPRKEDYRYNFAVSGDGCGDLLGGTSMQTYGLLALMDEAPARWRNGVVVIRIGVNDFGGAEMLEALAQDPMADKVQQRIAACLQAIGRSVALLHARHPQLRIVLVGIFDNAQWAKFLDRWQSPVMLANIGAGLEVFDRALRGMARNDPRIAFFDDRAWFAAHWGARDAQGLPAYRELALGGLRIGNTSGDAPDNAVLADGHAGTAWNGYWVQSLVSLLNARFGTGIAPVTEAEIAALVKGGQPGSTQEAQTASP